MKSGIYALYNSKSGKVYIGQSRNLEARKYGHFHSLGKGKHHNKYLQRAYNKDGAEAFQFIILEECEIEDMNRLEVKYIKRFQAMDSELGYNLESGGNADKEVSESVRLAKVGSNNPMYGKHLPAEHIEALRLKNRGNHSILTENEVTEIKKMLSERKPVKEVADAFGVTKSVINKIKTGKNFYWVTPELNELITEEHFKSIRNEQIFKMDAEGYSRNQIAKALGIQPGTVSKVLNRPSEFFYKNNAKKQMLAENVAADFKNGMSKKEIMCKYGINQSLYVNLTSKAYNEKKEAVKEKAVEMRKAGVMVKDIAKELGYARTTITKWTKQVM